MPDDTPKWIKDLAAAMVAPPQVSFSGIQAGYTYLGQLISHDIVPPTRGGKHPRAVGPVLNLESIYGQPQKPGGPWPALNSKGRFTRARRRWDVRRDRSGKALIAEQRNDENVITCQLHLFWQRLHNGLLRKEYARGGKQARECVVLLFQMVVVEDYLHRVLDPRVFDAYFLHHERHLGLTREAIPPEFSHAAFRFGHSMIRPFYQLNSNEPRQDFPIGELVRVGAIPSAKAIHWHLFFSENNPATQMAGAIDSSVTPLLVKIPTGSGDAAVELAELNLYAGWQAELPTGLMYAKSLMQGFDGHARLASDLGLMPLGSRSMRALGMPLTELPLWPYILLEAEVHNAGQRLGVLGSLIVAETLHDAIRRAEPSIFRHGGYDFDEVCARIGKLGEQIDKRTRRGTVSGAKMGRLKMHHLLGLLAKLEKS